MVLSSGIVFNNMPSHISALHLYLMFDGISWQLETTMMPVFYHWQALTSGHFFPTLNRHLLTSTGVATVSECSDSGAAKGQLWRERYPDSWGIQMIPGAAKG